MDWVVGSLLNSSPWPSGAVELAVSNRSGIVAVLCGTALTDLFEVAILRKWLPTRSIMHMVIT